MQIWKLLILIDLVVLSCLNRAMLIIKYCTMLGAETDDRETLPSPTRMISISSRRGGSHAYGNAQRDGQREVVVGL